MSKKIFGSKIFWVQTNFGSKKILGSKKFWVQKKVGPNKKCGPKKMRLKKILGSTKFGSKKILDTNFWSKKNLVLKKIPAGAELCQAQHSFSSDLDTH